MSLNSSKYTSIKEKCKPLSFFLPTYMKTWSIISTNLGLDLSSWLTWVEGLRKLFMKSYSLVSPIAFDGARKEKILMMYDLQQHSCAYY